jgi:Cd2+/Zn2+-exporting ATPase
MGAAGADAALETADVALMSDELVKIPYAIRLSRATSRNIRMNIAFSLVLKAAFLGMAVAGTATLWMAVVADTGASLIVVANALRLLRE